MRKRDERASGHNILFLRLLVFSCAFSSSSARLFVVSVLLSYSTCFETHSPSIAQDAIMSATLLTFFFVFFTVSNAVCNEHGPFFSLSVSLFDILLITLICCLCS